MQKTIIFDFDGTIADTLKVVIDSLAKIFPKSKAANLSEQELVELQDLTVPEIFAKFRIPLIVMPFIMPKIEKHLGQRIHELKIFPGVKEVIRDLHAEGYRLFIVSLDSKQNISAFLRLNELELFSEIYSVSPFFTKHYVLKELVRTHTIDPKTTLFVGDEVRDMLACKKSGINIINVTWGYNSETALQKAGARVLAHTPKELIDIVRSSF
jgi:phosphoglycolate phosphatase